MRIVLDSNRYTDFVRGVEEAIDVIHRAHDILLPFIVLAELRAGFRSGRVSARNEQSLLAFLRGERISVLFPDDDTTHGYAGLYAQLKQAGTPIPTNDLWIAALTLQHRAYLYSRDAHFAKLPQIARI
ncbi:MAG TPA: type II toxin-antitoxin system VapC family toxin [Phycisphaerae bacterium]|nr:type II toxin-antitoxin system VapC family toxin [Phycisphaerae bacterium]